MSLIEMRAISLALTLARCLSFVQNGAEAGEYSSCRVETSDVCVLSHGAECAPRKAPLSRLEFEPFSASCPYNHMTVISFRKYIKYLKASLYLLWGIS